MVGSISSDSSTASGNLNIYTMETGDGREIELAVIDEYICWRRVNDITWEQLVPLSSLKGASPTKGIDYWTEEDKAEILDYVNEAVGGNIPHNNLLDRNAPDAHPISSITGLEERLISVSDKKYVHSQNVASKEWDIIHNLDKYPSVTVVDSARSIVIGEVIYNDMNSLTIRFNGAFSGKAYLN